MKQTASSQSPRAAAIGIFTALSASVLLSECATSTVVTPVGSVKDAGNGGVIYTLPRTAIDVKFPLTLTTTEPGKYKNYVYLLPIDALTAQVITETNATLSLGSPDMAAVGVADPTKTFFAAFSGGITSDNSLTLSFNSNGTLTSALSESENKTSDFVVSIAELGLKLAASAISFAAAQPTETTTNEEQKAAFELRDRIKVLTAARNSAVEDHTHSDPAFDSRLKELDQELAALLAQFLGSKKTETWTAQFRVVPVSSTTVELFRYSKTGIEFLAQPSTTCPFKLGSPGTNASSAQLSFEITPRISQEANSHLAAKGETGFYYNIPADGHVTLKNANRIVSSLDTGFGQFGTLAYLPASTGSRKTHFELSLDAVTGALTKFVLNSTAYDSSQIAGLGTAASGLINTQNPTTALQTQAAQDKARYESMQYQRQMNQLNSQSGPLSPPLQ